MGELQLLRRVEVPIALPVIMSGVRSSAVTVVATATLAAVVGGGTLGAFILDGLFNNDQPRIFGAAVLVTWELRDSVGWFAAIGIGAAVWLGGSFGIGFVFELATASFVRRTQRLALEGDRDEPDEEIW